MTPLDPTVMRKLRADKERAHIKLVMKQPVLVVPPPTTEPLRGYRTEPLPHAVRNRNEQLYIDPDTPESMQFAIMAAWQAERPFSWA